MRFSINPKTWHRPKPRTVVISVLALVSIASFAIWGPLRVHAGNACVSNGTGGGNWNTAATWSSCGGTTPQSADTVTITAGDTVTLNTSPTITSLVLGSGAANTTLSDDGTGRTLTISGTVDMGQPTSIVFANTWNINTGTATVGGLITFSGTAPSSKQVAKIVITTGTLNANGGMTFTSSASAAAIIDMSGGAGNLNLKGALTIPATSCTFTFGTTSNFNYNDSSAQTINFPTAGTYNNLLINNAGGATLSAAVTTGNVGGGISVQSGTFKNGGFAIAGNSGKTFSVSASAIFEMSGTSTYPTTFTFSYDPASTVRYLQTSAMNMTTATYGNLDVKAAATATLSFPTGTTTVAGNLTVGDGTHATTASGTTNIGVTVAVTGNVSVSASSTLIAPSTTMTVGGNWTNAGTFTNSSSTVKFTGTSNSATITSGGSSFYNLSMNNGLQGYWKMDEGTGTSTTADSSGNSRTGTLVNSPTWTSSVTNSTYYGNDPGALNEATNQSVTFSSFALAGEFTLAGWVKVNDTPSNNDVMFPFATGNINFFAQHIRLYDGSGDQVTASYTTTTGTWVHYVITRQSSDNKIRIYINGNTTPDATSGSAFATSISPNGIGISGTFATFDDMRIYNRALSTTEIGELGTGTHPVEGTYTMQDAMTVSNALTVYTGKLDVSASNYGLTDNGAYTNVANFGSRAGTVTFGATSGTKNIQSDPSFYDLTINGSGGTFAVNAQPLVVTDNLALTNGTLDASASSCYGAAPCNVTVTGNLTSSGSGWALTMRSATWTVSGNWDTSSANNLTIGTSTVVMNGASSKTLKTGGAGGGSYFYNLQVGAAGGKTTQLLSNIAFSNIFTLGAGTVDVNGAVLYAYCGGSNTNPLSLNGSGTFTDTAGNGSLIYSSALGGCNQNLPGFTYGVGFGDQSGGVTVTQTGNVTFTGGFSLGCCTTVSAITTGTYTTGNFSLTVGSVGWNNGNFTFQAGSSNITVTNKIFGSNWAPCSGCSAGPGVFTAGTSTVSFTETTSGGVFDTSNGSFYNLTFAGSGGGWAPTAAVVVTNDLTLTAGTVSGTSNFTVNGNVTCGVTCGTITLTSSSTFEQRVASSKNFGSTTGAAGWTFYNLTFSNSSGSAATITTSSGGGGIITASNTLIIGKAGDSAKTTLDAGNRAFTLSGAVASPLQINNDGHGSALTGNTSTFTYSGNYGSGDTLIDPDTNGSYFNLSFNNASETYDLSGATTVTGTLTTTRGIFTTTGSNYALTVGKLNISQIITGTTAHFNASPVTVTGITSTLISISASSTFDAGTSTFTITSASGTPTLLSAAATFHILTINSAATVINAGANITTDNTAGNKFYIQSGVFNLENRTITPGTAGTLQVDSGGTFCLGGTTSATNATCDSGITQTSASTFPAFSSITLDPASTVIYLADAAQTISSSPSSYGNLTFKPKLTAGRTYTMGGAATIAGNFDINPGTAANLLTVNAAGDITVGPTKTTTIEATTSATSKLVLRPSSTDYNLSTGALTISSGGTLDATSAASTISVALNYTNNGTFTAGSSTFTLNGTAPSKTLSGTLNGSSAFYNVLFSGSGGDWTPSSAVLITNDLTMTAGSLLGTQDVTVNGTVAGTAGIVNLTGGTFLHRPSGNKNFGTSSGSTAWTFNNLTFGMSGGICSFPAATITTAAGTGSITIGGVLTIAQGSDTCAVQLNAGNRTWNLSGSNATPFVITSSPAGVFVPSTSTFVYMGTAGANVTATTYNNLSINSSGQTFVLTGSTTASDLTITAGTFDVTGSNYALAVNGSWSNSGTFTARSGTVTFGTSGSKTLGGTMTGGSSFYNAVFNGVGTWTLNAALATTNNFDITSGTFDTNNSSNYAVTVAGNLTGNSGTWSLTLRGSTVTVSGNWDTSAVATDSSSIAYGTSTVVMNGSGTKTLKTGATNSYLPRFYNLQVGAAGGKTTQLLESTGLEHILTLGAGTFDLNSKNIYVESYANPLSLNGSGTWGTSNGSLVTYGANDVNLPAFTYHSSVWIQQDATYKMVQQGTVTISGDLTIGCCSRASGYDTGSQTLTVQNDIILSASGNFITLGSSAVGVGRNWTGVAGGVVTPGTSTVTFNGGSGGSITSGGQSFYNATVNGTGTWTVQDAASITNDLTMTAGTLAGTQNVTVNGNVAATNGVITMTGSSTFEQRVASSKNFGAASGSTAWTFSSLTFSNSSGSPVTITTQAGTGAQLVTGVFTIGKGGDSASTTLSAGSRTWSMSGTTGTPFVVNGAFTAASSQMKFTGNNTGGDTTIPALTYNNLTVNNASETFDLAGTTTVAALTITQGTLDVTASNYALNISGNFTNNGTFTARSGTVTLNGAAQQTLSGSGGFTSGSALYNLTITNNSGANATDNEITGFTASVVFSVALTTTHTFTITTASVRVQYASTLTYTFNTVNWNGQSKLTRIFFRSSVAGSNHWVLNVTNQTAVSYVNVSRSDATTSAGPILANDTTSYDSGNNINWTFGTTITVSGNIYIQGSESSTNSTPVSVSLSVNNGAPSTITGQTSSYSMVNTYDGAGSVITVYIDGDASLNATTFTVGNGSDVTGLNLYINRSAIYNHNSSDTTNANICAQSTYPTAGDATFTCSSSVPTFSGDGVIVNGGYAPGGNVNAPEMEINSAGTYTGSSETLTLTGSGTGTSRPFYINSGSFKPGSDTVTFTGTSASTIETTTYYNLQLYPTSGTQIYTPNSGSLTVGHNLDIGNGSTLTVAANTNNPTVAVSGNMTINSSTTWTNGSGSLAIGGSYANSGTYTAGTGTVTFNSTASGKTLSGTMNGSSAFYKLAFSGTGGAWTIQDPIIVTHDATDTLNITAGTVTLGNGTGDNLEVRGGLLIGATANQTATLQTAAIAIGGTITIDINQNSSGTPPACTNCGITVGATSGSGTGSFKLAKNTILRLNPDSTQQTDLPVVINSTGYFETKGTQDYTGTSSAGTGETAILDSGKSWTAAENNGKVVRMTSGLAKGQIYTITGTSATQLSRTSTESSPATMTVSGSGNNRLICSNSTSLITSDGQGAGRYIHDKTGATGYLLIISSLNNDAACSGSKDSFRVAASPDSLGIARNNDTFTLSDGVQSGDTYEVLDYATITAEAGTACTATTNETGKGEAYINAAAGSETLIRYADICNLGRNASSKYGLTFTNINGENVGDGVTVDKSRISKNYYGINTVTLTDGTFSDDFLTTNAAYGIAFSGTNAGPAVSSTIVANNGAEGIYLSSASGVALSSDVLYGNTTANLSFSGASDNTATTMTVLGNTGYGISLSGSSLSNNITSSTVEGAATAAFSLSGSSFNTLSSNTVMSTGNGFTLASSSASNLLSGNSATTSVDGIDISGSTNNTIASNTLTNNSTAGVVLESSSSANTVYSNTITANLKGVLLSSSNGNTFFSNTNSGNTWGLYTAVASTGTTVISESFSTNATADIDLNSTASTLSLYKTTLASNTPVTGASNASAAVISRRPANTAGETQVWGHYSTPSEVSETPQIEATEKYNYADNLWEISTGAHGYSGSGTEDTDLNYGVSSADLSGGPYQYRMVSNTNGAVCGSTSFTVYRNGSNIGTATCGTMFTDGSAKLTFIIDGGTSVHYASGDTYTFTAWDASGDTSTRKTVQLMDTGGSYAVPSGTTLQLLGQSATANPSEVTRGGAGLGWHMNVTGTINAQYYVMDYLGGTSGATGLNLVSGATVTNLAHGTFTNFQDTGGATDTFITIAGSLIGSGTPAKTFDGLSFTLTNGAPSFSITESGPGGSSGNYWLFSTTTCNGWSTCEGSDSDLGDGAGSPNQDGYVRFTTSGTGSASVDARAKSGTTRVKGGTVQVK